MTELLGENAPDRDEGSVEGRRGSPTSSQADSSAMVASGQPVAYPLPLRTLFCLPHPRLERVSHILVLIEYPPKPEEQFLGHRLDRRGCKLRLSSREMVIEDTLRSFGVRKQVIEPDAVIAARGQRANILAVSRSRVPGDDLGGGGALMTAVSRPVGLESSDRTARELFSLWQACLASSFRVEQGAPVSHLRSNRKVDPPSQGRDRQGGKNSLMRRATRRERPGVILTQQWGPYGGCTPRSAGGGQSRRVAGAEGPCSRALTAARAAHLAWS